MHHDYDDPVYPISVVAKVLIIHPQTLRQYEREGLIRPSRTNGKMRLYSQGDIDRIKLIQNLTRELGVNLAGVDIIMQLKDKINEYEVLVESLRLEIHTLSKKSTQTKNPLVKHKSRYEIILPNGE